MPRLRTAFLIKEVEHQPGLLVRTQQGHPIQAETVGEALRVTEELLGIKIVAESGPYDLKGNYRLRQVPRHDGMWVVIFVMRGKERIYPGHDLTLRLLESDVVAIGGMCD